MVTEFLPEQAELCTDSPLHCSSALVESQHEVTTRLVCLISTRKQQACPDTGLVLDQSILANIPLEALCDKHETGLAMIPSYRFIHALVTLQAHSARPVCATMCLPVMHLDIASQCRVLLQLHVIARA